MITLIILFLPIYIFIIGNLIYISKHKHLLIVLLRLEFIVLRIFFFFLIFLINVNFNLYFLMVFLVFAVCEGVLGLSLLVFIIRTHGNDYFQRFNILL